jgi:hypothetical protein
MQDSQQTPNEELKEAYRLFFLVKGHLDATPETVLGSANGYFKRLWYDGANGAPLYNYDSDFNIAWENKYGTDSN